jgi:hypothetical protein
MYTDQRICHIQKWHVHSSVCMHTS